MNKKYKLIIILTSIFAALFLSVIIYTNSVTAVTASDWKPGRIIDDVIFTNKDSMTVSEIQTFLNNKVGTGTNGTPGQCDTYGTKTSEFGGGTRAQYAANASLHPNQGAFYPPFTCLKDYYEVPKTTASASIPDNNYGGKAIPSGAISAAQIIWNAAEEYNISPKVLLVKLGTESAGPLTSDDWPTFNQYLYAMGSHCPDSGAGGSANCDTDYAGFSIQMYSAASLLRWYLDNMTQSWWPYKKPYQANSILWNVVERGCGASDVYIENKATAALYTYTPYQPNQAALNNMYGTGDGCSAYGNRNFWRVYNDWFGSSYAPNFSAQSVWQQVYTDSTKTTSLGWNASIMAGQSAYVSVVMKNTGNTTWTNSGAFGSTDTRLATYGPWGRSSAFCDNTWIISCTRPATLKEASVAPGEYGTFEFSIKAPNQAGSYTEVFSPIVDGRTVFSNGSVAFNFTVTPAIFSAQSVWQQVYTDSTKTTSLGWNATLLTKQKAYAVVIMKNTGNTTWTNSGAFGSTDTRLATFNGWGRQSGFCDTTWVISCTRPTTLKESSVAPGAYGTFEFYIQAPNTPGTYSESFAPIIDGRTTFTDGSAMGIIFKVQ